LAIWISAIRICLEFRILCFGLPKRSTPETVEPGQFSPAELVDSAVESGGPKRIGQLSFDVQPRTAANANAVDPVDPDDWVPEVNQGPF